jgi:hypothetical protein
MANVNDGIIMKELGIVRNAGTAAYSKYLNRQFSASTEEN